MKKILTIIITTSLFTTLVPVFAEENYQQSPDQSQSEQFKKECDILLKNCAMEVDSIQERINKLQAAISGKSANHYTLEELKILNKKLQEANETMRELNRPGR
jgi:peptidoglycan hydrolase CwlO-like protein